MSILDRNMTLMDVARMTSPDGKIMPVVELLSESNPMLDDMTFVECNNGMTNIATVRTGLPEGTWRKLYGGVMPEKGTTRQIQDTCGMLETYSEPDASLIDMAPDKAKALLNESAAFLEGVSQTMAQTVIYGDVKIKPETFEGLASRYNAYGDVLEDKVSAFNVINAGGSGSKNTSIYIVSWGDNKVTGLYPKGSKAGLSHEDKGKVTVQESDGSRREAYRQHYKWDIGLAVKDWRYAARICNIDVDALAAAGTSAYSGPNLTLLLIEAIGRLPANFSSGKHAIYCNRLVHTALNKMAQDKHNVNLTIEEFGGKKIPAFWGIPIKRVDSLLSTEETVPKYTV